MAGRGIRFYGVVTLGNLIMAFAALVPILVWGVRLEGRVDKESELRSRLEQAVVESRTERRNEVSEIKVMLSRITEDVTALRIQSGTPRKTGDASRP